MTEYIHGRPVRDTRRRRRSALVIAAVLLVATLVGLHLADSSGADEPAGSANEPAAVGTPARAQTASTDPELAGLNKELAKRFAKAQRAAADDGVALTLTSGKRSVAEQQDLVDAAVKRYGSTKEAHRWVLPPGSSSHVKGLAVDVGPTAGAVWLGEHGLDFGLCRTYANEVWHFEKLPKGRDTCPTMHKDSSSGW